MDIVTSELDGTWLRFVVGIPLDVLLFLSAAYLSAGLTWFLLRTSKKNRVAITVISTSVIFVSYYLYLRPALLDSPLLACLCIAFLAISLLMVPAFIVPDRSRTLLILKVMVCAATRRTLECGFALVALIVLAPLLILISVLVKLTTPGTIFLRQHGSSHGGKPITLYSFRTRVQYKYSYSIDAYYMTSERDWRLTQFGKVLRRSSLHLLPRLFNVLTGDLHLVGLTPLGTDLLLDKFSKELLRREYDLVAGLYDVSGGIAFRDLFDYCLPTGLVTYADLKAYQIRAMDATVTKNLDMRPRLIQEAEYFLSSTFPSVRLLVVLIGKFCLRLLTAMRLLRLEEIR